MTEPKISYGTVTQALEDLKKKGYLIDFNLNENCIVSEHGNFGADDFKIVEIYRYEGDSNPEDESAVYAIESSSGLKGVLVTSYGTSAEKCTAEILNKLHY
jgi:hypothetical protein